MGGGFVVSTELLHIIDNRLKNHTPLNGSGRYRRFLVSKVYIYAIINAMKLLATSLFTAAMALTFTATAAETVELPPLTIIQHMISSMRTFVQIKRKSS